MFSNKTNDTPTKQTDTSNSNTHSKTASSTDFPPTGLLTPTGIINELFIQTHSPDVLSKSPSTLGTPFKYLSPAASSGPICRICHEGDLKEDLVSPCLCAGTVGLVHKTCMERWLSTRNNSNDKCEICNYAFPTSRSPKSAMEWIRSEHNTNQRRSLLGDITCFLLLTPLAIVSSFLCVEGSKRQVRFGNNIEAGCLMALATFLVTIYIFWNAMTLRYHTLCYLRWRAKNQNVKLLSIKRVSTVQPVFQVQDFEQSSPGVPIT